MSLLRGFFRRRHPRRAVDEASRLVNEMTSRATTFDLVARTAIAGSCSADLVLSAYLDLKHAIDAVSTHPVIADCVKRGLDYHRGKASSYGELREFDLGMPLMTLDCEARAVLVVLGINAVRAPEHAYVFESGPDAFQRFCHGPHTVWRQWERWLT